MAIAILSQGAFLAANDPTLPRDHTFAVPVDYIQDMVTYFEAMNDATSFIEAGYTSKKNQDTHTQCRVFGSFSGQSLVQEEQLKRISQVRMLNFACFSREHLQETP